MFGAMFVNTAEWADGMNNATIGWFKGNSITVTIRIVYCMIVYTVIHGV